jgi:hypothetical protein
MHLNIAESHAVAESSSIGERIMQMRMEIKKRDGDPHTQMGD